MTEQQREELKKVLAEQTARHIGSREDARAFLIKTGTYTADGNLAPEFGGPEKDRGN
jgi:hypothetical protein